MFYAVPSKEKQKTNLHKKKLQKTCQCLNTAAYEQTAREPHYAGHYWRGNADWKGTGVVQRRLFIRTERDIVVKNDTDMNDNIRSSRPGVNQYKEPHYVSADKGYVRISDHDLEGIFNGYIQWLRQNNKNDVMTDRKEIISMIKEMIGKTVLSAEPTRIYKTLESTPSTMPRLPSNTEKIVSYYFDSLDEFYKYLYLSRKIKKQRNEEALKINFVNTGAGDAILVTLPKGYLIVDLGTDINILLNFLALHKNRHGNPDRGIPLQGDETCIVITHNDSDHKGCKVGKKDFIKDLEKEIIIGYKQYLQAKAGDDHKFQRLTEFLESGGFYVCELIEDNKTKNSNTDSLVIGRRIGQSEAIILSGDQEPSRLEAVIKGMQREDTKYKYVLFKVPHHASYRNINASMIKELINLGDKIDFEISSGNNYQHPTSGAFVSGFKLFSQGTLLQHSENPDNPNGKSKTIGGVFYTANLNSKNNIINLGSIVYKSDGEDHVIYSKRYTDNKENGEDNENEEKYNEKDKIEQMLAGMQKTGEETFNLCYRIMHLSDFDLRENALLILSALHQNNEGLDFLKANVTKYPWFFAYIFYAMEEKLQKCVIYLLIKDETAFKLFLERLDISRMNDRFGEAFINFFYKNIKNIINLINIINIIGQPFFDIIMRFDDKENLCNLLIAILDYGNLEYANRFLLAALNYGTVCMESFIQILLDYFDHFPNSIELLDAGIIMGMFYTDIELESKISLLKCIPEEKKCLYYRTYLLSPMISFEEFYVFFFLFGNLLDQLNNAQNFDFWQKAYQMFLESNPNISEKILGIMKFTPAVADIKLNTVEEICSLLENSKIGFIEFIKNLSQKSVLDNWEVCFQYATIPTNYNDYNDIENVAALLEIGCDIVDDTKLSNSLNELICSRQDFIEYLAELFSGEYLVPDAENRCYSVLLKLPKVNELFNQEELFNQKDSLALLSENLPKIIAWRVLSLSNIEWFFKNQMFDIQLKTYFYDSLISVDSKLAANIFSLHINYSSEDAGKVFQNIRKENKRMLLNNFHIEYAWNILSYLWKGNATNEIMDLYEIHPQ